MQGLQDVYNALRDYQREKGYSPRIRELAARAGWCVPTTLDALKLLARQGSVRTRLPGAPRRYYIATEPNQYEKP